MGHVLTGWDGTNPLLNPTNLCKWQMSYLPRSVSKRRLVSSLPDVSGALLRFPVTHVL